MEDNDNRTAYSLEEEEFADFNPLEDFDFDEDEDEDGFVPGVLDEGPYSMPEPDNAPQFKLVAFDNAEAASERIDTLFDQMPTLQRMLTDILGLCLEPVATGELEAGIAELQEHHHTIYTPLTFLNLLERAGAVYQCDAEGTSLEEFEQEPLRVEVDGVAYWQVAPAPEVYWTVSPEGAARYESYRPIEMTRAVFEAEPVYADIFQTVLQICARDGGAPIKDIGDVVDDEPILQQPRRYAMYFIDKLEHAGAVEWRGSWMATEAGRSVLEERMQLK